MSYQPYLKMFLSLRVVTLHLSILHPEGYQMQREMGHRLQRLRCTEEHRNWPVGRLAQSFRLFASLTIALLRLSPAHMCCVEMRSPLLSSTGMRVEAQGHSLGGDPNTPELRLKFSISPFSDYVCNRFFCSLFPPTTSTKFSWMLSEYKRLNEGWCSKVKSIY